MGYIGQTPTAVPLDSDDLSDGIVTSAKLATGIDATKLADGSVTSTELQYINTLSSNAQTQIDGAGLTSETGSFTRDISTASGTQAITGVGFQPTALIVFVGGGGVGRASWGMASSDGSEVCVNHYHNVSSDQFEHWSNLIRIEYGSGENYRGDLTSFDTDGFTITWTKAGSPTGTVGCKFIAFK